MPFLSIGLAREPTSVRFSFNRRSPSDAFCPLGKQCNKEASSVNLCHHSLHRGIIASRHTSWFFRITPLKTEQTTKLLLTITTPCTRCVTRYGACSLTLTPRPCAGAKRSLWCRKAETSKSFPKCRLVEGFGASVRYGGFCTDFALLYL